MKPSLFEKCYVDVVSVGYGKMVSMGHLCWHGQNVWSLSLAFIIDWRVVREVTSKSIVDANLEYKSLPPLPDASCALQHYIDAGVVEVLPWQGLDLRSGSEIRTEGMFAALNDCLYRHMYTSGSNGLKTQKKSLS